MHSIKQLGRCLWRAACDTVLHDGIEHAGYMAFLSLLALFPFLVFVVSLAGFIGESSMGVHWLVLILERLPEGIAVALKPRIDEIISGPPQGLLTLAIMGAIWTASSSVEGLRTILNRAYRVVSLPPYWQRRCLSVVQFFLLTVLMMVSMSMVVLMPWLLEVLTTLFQIEADITYAIWHILQYIIIFLTLFLVLGSLYYMLPNTEVRLHTVLPGTLLVMALWIIAAIGLSIYFMSFRQVSIIYGSLGGIIVTLLFFYLLNILFIFGAEFNYQYEQHIIQRSGLRA